MDVVSNNYLPGDPRLIDHIVYELKSQGIFDNFRKECIADVDTKPAYQNLRQRVEGSVAGFLNTQKWKPDMNKNQVREMLRKNISESGFLETGVERIVDQVVNPKINTIFLPQVENVVYKVLGIEKPITFEQIKIETIEKDMVIDVDNSSNLLPSDLETVSPESEHDRKLDITTESQLDVNKIDDDESPPFEPLEEATSFAVQEENSVDSHLSGFSGLASHDSNHSFDVANKTNAMEISNQDSQFSKQSSEDHSFLMSDETECKTDINEDSNMQKPLKIDLNSKTSEGAHENSVNGKNSASSKQDKEKKSDSKSEKEKHRSSDKHRSRNDSKSDNKNKSDKDKKGRDKKEHRDKDRSKHSSKDSKEREKKDEKSKTGKDEKDGNKSDKEHKHDKEKDRDRSKSSLSRHSSNSSKGSKKDGDNKGKGKESDLVENKNDKETKKDDKDKKESEHKEHKSRDSEHKDAKKIEHKDTKKDESDSSKIKEESKSRDHSSSKSKGDSKSHSKHHSKSSKEKSESEKSKLPSKTEDKHKKDDKHRSHDKSSSKKDDKYYKDRKDSKKDIKKSKDDHYSLKKSSHRRSPDRDSSDGHSGNHSSSSSFADSSSSTQLQKISQENSTITSQPTSGESGNSDQIEEISISSTPSGTLPESTDAQFKSVEIPPVVPPVKLIKPKFASNIFEARRLMKIRKKLGKIEKQSQMGLIKTGVTLSDSETPTDANNTILTYEIVQVTHEEEKPPAVNEEVKQKPNILKKTSKLRRKLTTSRNLKVQLLRSKCRSYHHKQMVHKNIKRSKSLEADVRRVEEEEEEDKVEEVVAVEDFNGPLQNSVISKESWDAVEARLLENMMKATSNSYVNPSDDSDSKSDSSDCLYLSPEITSDRRGLDVMYKLIKYLEKDIEKKERNMPNVKRKLPKIDIVDVQNDREIIISPSKGTKRHADHSDVHNNNKLQMEEEQMDKVNNTRVNSQVKNTTSKAKKAKVADGTGNHLDTFALPLSPAESDKSFTINERKSEKDEIKVKRNSNVNKAINTSNNQRYSTDDLYKPRLQFNSSRRRAAKSQDFN